MKFLKMGIDVSFPSITAFQRKELVLQSLPVVASKVFLPFVVIKISWILGFLFN
jgi:hypothetical protein